MDLKKVKKALALRKIEWKRHSLQRMMQRGISRKEVIETIEFGEIIEEYLDEKPYASVLVFNKLKLKYLHVVYAFDKDEEKVYVITAYEPSKEIFGDDLKTRIKR